jgi:hypothetical protein
MVFVILPDAAGFFPPDITHDYVWNRVINMKGRKAGNIGKDLANEFLNNDFKCEYLSI